MRSWEVERNKIEEWEDNPLLHKCIASFHNRLSNVCRGEIEALVKKFAASSRGPKFSLPRKVHIPKLQNVHFWKMELHRFCRPELKVLSSLITDGHHWPILQSNFGFSSLRQNLWGLQASFLLLRKQHIEHWNITTFWEKRLQPDQITSLLDQLTLKSRVYGHL